VITPLPEHAVILLVEDRQDDIEIIRRAFDQVGLLNPLQIVRDGEEAIDYLRGSGKYANRTEYPLPDLVLLDLKMPKIDGFQTLEWIRHQSGIRSIPVVVLTSSEMLRDVNRAYSLGANSFLVKPTDFQNSVELARVLREYWVKTVKFPETFRPPPKKNGTKSRA
jgi:CheY-like chemotaxis protein